MLVAALTGVGRMQLGIDQADSSRYVGFSLMVLLGCIFYIHSNNDFPLNKFRFLKLLNFKNIKIFLGLVLIASFCVGIHKSLNFSEFMRKSQFYILTYDTQPDINLMEVMPYEADKMKVNGEILKSRGLHVFYNYDDPLLKTSSMITAPLENYTNYIVIEEASIYAVPDDPYLQISGAAIDPNGKGPVDTVIIAINGQRYLADYGFRNTAIKKISKKSRFRHSGFSRSIPLRLLPEGESNIKIQLLSDDMTILYETTNVLNLKIFGDKVEITRIYTLPEPDVT
jgi:hypothetical protein